MRLTAVTVVALLALVSAARVGARQTRPAGAIALGTGWELSGERTAIVKDGDRDVLQVETGFAHRRDVRLQDGTIDFDVRVTNRRSFVYVYFRAVSDGEREEFYLRPHKSGLPDAVQYAPVWQNKSAWQLHHGPGGTSPMLFEPGEWTHVRVVVQGRHAALFVKDMAKPVLLVPRLSRTPAPGYIALGGFPPGGVPGQGPIAAFANVSVRRDVVPFDFAAALRPQPETAPRRAIADRPRMGCLPVVRPERRERQGVARWQRGQELSAYRGRDRRTRAAPSRREGTRRSRVAAAVARIKVTAERAGTFAFDLGFSDIAHVFVNGAPLFRGDATYSYDRPRREGLIGYDQARLYLPLTAGENDLSIVVSDSFGGWGIMGRFVGSPPLTLEVYVRPFPQVDSGRWQVSPAGGTRPGRAAHRRAWSSF